MVPRKLYKAWDCGNKTMVALKLVEVYGFAAASAWAGEHVAVPSVLMSTTLYTLLCVWNALHLQYLWQICGDVCLQHPMLAYK